MSDAHPRSNPEWDQELRDDWYQHVTPSLPRPGTLAISEDEQASRERDARTTMEVHVEVLEDLRDHYGVAGERVFDRAVLFVRDQYRVRRDRAWNQ